MIWIIGGTSETVKFLEKCKESNKFIDFSDFIVTVTTEDALKFLSDFKVDVKVGKMEKADMYDFVEENTITKCIDLSHPHARIVSQNASEVCNNKNISYFRYARPFEKIYMENLLYFENYEELIKYLKKLEYLNKNFFFTTGVSKVVDFEKVKGNNRYIYRVLPSVSSLEILNNSHVEMNNIVCILGPVSQELNEAMLMDFNADYLVMKDSGIASKSKERIMAANKLGIKTLCVSMKEENGFADLDSIVELI